MEPYIICGCIWIAGIVIGHIVVAAAYHEPAFGVRTMNRAYLAFALWFWPLFIVGVWIYLIAKCIRGVYLGLRWVYTGKREYHD